MIRPREALAVLLAASALPAQEPPAAGDGAPMDKVVSGAWGTEFRSQYFFRGILRENQGILAEPWLQLGYELYAADSGVRNVDLTLGLWNSLHNGPTGSGGGATMWSEADFWVSLSGGIGDRFDLGTTYTVYHSPNAGFETVAELSVSARLDDRDLLGAGFGGLQPSVAIAFELDGQADAGGEAGIYAQLGIEPRFDRGDRGLSLSLPVTLGLSLRDYYEFGTGRDDAFGYLDVGAVLSMPLEFLPRRMGPWIGSAGLHYLVLGDNNEARNGGDAGELLFTLAFSTAF